MKKSKSVELSRARDVGCCQEEVKSRRSPGSSARAIFFFCLVKTESYHTSKAPASTFAIVVLFYRSWSEARTIEGRQERIRVER